MLHDVLRNSLLASASTDTGRFGSVEPGPLTGTISTARKVSGLSRSEVYRRLAAGDLKAVKSGKRTLILMDSLRAHLASLPPATFRAPKTAI